MDKAKTGGLNGLKAEKDRLLLGGWSVRGADGKEQVGHISTVTYADQKLGRLGDQPRVVSFPGSAAYFPWILRCAQNDGVCGFKGFENTPSS